MKKISPNLHAKLVSGCVKLMKRSQDSLLKAKVSVELDAAVELGLETAESAATKKKGTKPKSVVMVTVPLTDYHDALERYEPNDEPSPNDTRYAPDDDLPDRWQGSQPSADSGTADVRETERS